MSSLLAEREETGVAYPERREGRDSPLDRAVLALVGPMVRWQRRRTVHATAFLRAVQAERGALAQLSDAALRGAAAALRPRLRRDGFRDDVVARAFALVREAAGRTLGTPHYDVQLIGGRILLGGMVAEMDTGEGKTLTATLAVATAALLGTGVHVLTANDYLAARDARIMEPVYRALGLTVGTVVQEVEREQRREAYARDITYSTGQQVVFDYLRDRLTLGRDVQRLSLKVERLYGGPSRTAQLALRGLHFAIVDEADSLLIDEARTPLIISARQEGDTEREVFETALRLARGLAAGRDFQIDERERRAMLTRAGQAALQARAERLGGAFAGRLRREELVAQALSALHLFIRDRDYVVTPERTVRVVDEFTGRTMADRSWERGLHQLVEVKEDCPLTGVMRPLVKLSYQRFFRRYLRLGGMTGTGREVANELWSTYGLAVVRVPPRRPRQRRLVADHVFVAAETRWRAVVDRVRTLSAERRPVLVGTRSVEASEHLSGLLTAAEVPHRVLNARQDRDEADVVAEAGQAGRVTVATNMAGRGTDIALGPGVRETGGLHVIATECHEARRIDRQLFGRCGRQGDPGSYECLVSLDDDLVRFHARRWRAVARLFARREGTVPHWLGARVVRRAQRGAEALHAQMRRDLRRVDEQFEDALAFTGWSE